MFLFFEAFTVVIEVLFIHIYLTGIFLKYQKIPIWIITFYFTFSVVLSSLSILQISPFVRLSYTFISILIIAKILFKTKILSAFYCSLLLCIINIIVDNICAGLISIFGIPPVSLFEFGNVRIIFIISAKLIQLFCYLLVIKLSNWHRDSDTLFGAIPLFLCQVFSIFICYIMFLAVHENESVITLDFVIGAVGVLYINVVIFLYIERIKSVYEIRKQNELAEQQFKSELEYFQQLKEDQEETRALWHDISKYLNTMKSLIDVNEIDHARECVEQATEVFSSLGHVVDVGNTVVSAVLNQRVQKARRQNIHIDLDVRVPEEIGVSSPDLSIIIGNTFDNALEACELLLRELRHITICIIQKESFLYYEIENPFNEEDSAAKKTKKVQGYGLKNVKRCVDKYKGEMMIDKSNGKFRVSIHLNILKVTAVKN